MAIRHLDPRERLGIELYFIGRERTGRGKWHRPADVIEQRGGIGPVALDRHHRILRGQRATAADEAQLRARGHIAADAEKYAKFIRAAFEPKRSFASFTRLAYRLRPRPPHRNL